MRSLRLAFSFLTRYPVPMGDEDLRPVDSYLARESVSHVLVAELLLIPSGIVHMHDCKGREDRTTSGTHAAKHGGNRHIHPRAGRIGRVERGETETHRRAGGDIQSRRKVFGQCSLPSRKGETTGDDRDFLEGKATLSRLLCQRALA